MSFSRSIRWNSAGCSIASPMSFAALDLIYLQYFFPFLSAQSRPSSANPTAAPGLYLVLIFAIFSMCTTSFLDFGRISGNLLSLRGRGVSPPAKLSAISKCFCTDVRHILWNCDSRQPAAPANAEFPMLVKLFGSMTCFSSLHIQNAKSSIPVTPSGIIISVTLEQPQNACSPMRVTPVGIIICSSLLLFGCKTLRIMICPDSSANPRHPANALLLISVTLSGIVMFINFLHSPNALLPMLITLLGIVMLVKLLHR